jgi:iron complex outermembrane receptor protein
MFAGNFMMKNLARAYAGGAFASLALAGNALAQSTSSADRLDRVEVTGSAIKRIDGESALPVQVITREEIQRSGITSTEQLLKQVTATSTSGAQTVAGTTAGGGQGGNSSVATISLRALGQQRTLVLIDGRRSAPAGGGTAVDIASIPLQMIDRVEVLKDGASAIYGSDAIAGVVNFILRKDYIGAELSTTVGNPTRHGGGLETEYSGIAGWGNVDTDRFNITLGVDYKRTKAINGADRNFATNIDIQHSLDRLSSTSFPANVQKPGGGVISPTFPNCAPSQTSFSAPGVCRFDNAPFDDLQPDSKLEQVSLNGRFKINDAIEAYAQTSFTRIKTIGNEQPVLINGAAQTGGSPYAIDLHNLYNSQYRAGDTGGVLATLLFGSVANSNNINTGANAFALLPPSSPYYPTAFAAANGLAGKPLPLLLRSFQTGPRQTTDISSQPRFVAGFRGTVLGFDYDVGALYSKDRIQNLNTAGWTLTDQYLNLLNTGVINPFGPTADPAALAAAQRTVLNSVYGVSQNQIESLNAKVSRDLFNLPAGPLAFAGGAEFRREMLNVEPSFENVNFLVSGFGAPGVPIEAGRNVASAYLEFNAPIIKGLELDIAGRYDHYEGVGKTVNPKASLRWQPIDQLLFRAAVGKGFRAPSLTDLFLPPARGITTNGQRDLVRCPVVVASTDCSNQFVTIGGGNPALQPEKSRSQTIGFVFEPTKDYSLGVDAFYIAVKDTIRTAFSVAQILGNPFQFANLIQRGPPDGNASGVGPITGILQGQVNAGRTNTSGFDVFLRGRVYNTPGDKVTLGIDGTYTTRYDQQNPLDGSYQNAINIAGQGGIGIILRWRHTAYATWDHGPFALTFQHNYQVGYRDVNPAVVPAATTPPQVGSYTTLDTNLAYTGVKNLKVALGVKNIADRSPPYTNYGGGFIGGYDLSYADVRGRFVYGSVTYKFF